MSTMRNLRAVLKQGLSVAAVMGAGDIISQKLIEKQDYNFVRTIKYASIGFCVIGPTLHFWYMRLDKIIPPNKSLFKRGIHKMLYDQLLFAPVFNLVLIGVFGVVNGDNSARLKKRYTEDYADIMLKNYMLWPPSQIINFAFVPMQFQVLYVQVVALIWNCFLAKTLNAT